MKKILLLIFLSVELTSVAQNLNKIVSGGPFASNSFAQIRKLNLCSDGGILTYSVVIDTITGQWTFRVIKTDAQFNKIWISTVIDTAYKLYVCEIGEIPNGNGYYIFGNNQHTTLPFLIKLDNSGSIVWSKEITLPTVGWYGYPKLKFNSGGDFFVIPSSYDYMGFARLDQGGNYVSGVCFKADSLEYKNPGFDAVVTDSTVTLSGKADIDNFFLNCDYSGNVNWSFRFSDQDTGYHQPRIIKKSFDGGYLICGFGYDNPFASLSQSAFFMKMDSEGNILFLKNLYSANYTVSNITTITELSNGEYVLQTGGDWAFPTMYIKCDALGNPIKSYFMNFNTAVFNLAQNSLILGETHIDSASFTQQIVFHKTDFDFSNKCIFHDDSSIIASASPLNFILYTNYYYKFNMSGSVSNLPVPVIPSSENYTVSDACFLANIPENFFSQNNSISLFPQPSNSNVTIQLSSQSSSAITAEVFSLDGKKISSEKFNANSFQLSTTALSGGLYLLKVWDGKEIIGTKKLIVEK